MLEPTADGEDDGIYVCRVEKQACGFCTGISPPLEAGGECVIKSFHRPPRGGENPLLASSGGAVAVGDAFLAVNGTSTQGMPLERLVALMRDTPCGRTTLRFRRHREGARLPWEDQQQQQQQQQQGGAQLPMAGGIGGLLGRAASAIDGLLVDGIGGIGFGQAGADDAVARRKCLQEGAVLRAEDPVRWVQGGLRLGSSGGQAAGHGGVGGSDDGRPFVSMAALLSFAQCVYAEAEAAADKDADADAPERRRLLQQYPWLMAAAGCGAGPEGAGGAGQQQQGGGGDGVPASMKGAWPHAAAVGADVGIAVFDDG